MNGLHDLRVSARLLAAFAVLEMAEDVATLAFGQGPAFPHLFSALALAAAARALLQTQRLLAAQAEALTALRGPPR